MGCRDRVMVLVGVRYDCCKGVIFRQGWGTVGIECIVLRLGQGLWLGYYRSMAKLLRLR